MGACISQILCCCVGQGGNCILSSLYKSTSTRLMYTVGFILTIIIAWMLKMWGYKLPNTVDETCDKVCWSYLAVMRCSFALVIYHGLLSIFTFGVRNSQGWRASLHNNFWLVKFVVLMSFVGCVFLIPDQFFFNYHLAAIIFASMFILLQSLLLVDFAWAWAQKWIDEYEETGDLWYQKMLLATCGLMYILSLAGTIWMFIAYGHKNCSLELTFIGINILLCFGHTILSILPRIQEATPRSGLFQSGILSVYTTYLVASSLASQPYDWECSIELGRSEAGAFSETMIYVGLIFTFLSLGYSAFSAGSASIFNNGYSSLVMETETDDADDEQLETKYDYSFFHGTFAIAAFYSAMVLTDWEIMISNLTRPNGVEVVHGPGALWAKIVMSWLCCLLYAWTLLAPILLPDRDFS